MESSETPQIPNLDPGSLGASEAAQGSPDPTAILSLRAVVPQPEVPGAG